MHEISRILVITRITKYCKKAVQAGGFLARKHDASLCVYHSTYYPYDAGDYYFTLPSARNMVDDFKKEQEKARKELNDIIDRENADGMNIEVLVSEKDPDEEVFELVRDRNIDLLVLRAHEESRIEHFFFGRSTEKIIRKMPCSVLLVKDPVTA